jgi:acetylornithine deacetylase/succinyl-diaminopimelate desuccinylase-like protein
MYLFEILRQIAIPRPCHSKSLDEVIGAIKNLLASRDIPFVTQEVTLMPFKQLILGIFCLILGIVFFILIMKKKPVIALICIAVIPIVLILETEFIFNIVSPLVTKKSENIIMTFDVPEPERELIFAAHMDSKTDVFDHTDRKIIMMFLLPVIIMSLFIPVYLLAARKFKKISGKIPIRITQILAGVFVVFWFFFFLRMGGFIFLSEQSPGAVDDGTAAVSLIGLADQLNRGTIDRGNSRVTVLLTTGEEIGLQGADAYVDEYYRKTDRTGEPDPYLVNLELVAQNGNLIYWKKVGIFLNYYSTSQELIDRVRSAWRKVSGKDLESIETLGDDSYRFHAVGVPAVTIGHTGKPGLGLDGFHTPADNLDRVNRENLEMMAPLFKTFIESYN